MFRESFIARTTEPKEIEGQVCVGVIPDRGGIIGFICLCFAWIAIISGHFFTTDGLEILGLFNILLTIAVASIILRINLSDYEKDGVYYAIDTKTAFEAILGAIQGIIAIGGAVLLVVFFFYLVNIYLGLLFGLFTIIPLGINAATG